MTGNPSAVGNPDKIPIIECSDDLIALLNPCRGVAPSRGGYCGGVNGSHAADCPSGVSS